MARCRAFMNRANYKVIYCDNTQHTTVHIIVCLYTQLNNNNTFGKKNPLKNLNH